MLKEFEQHIIRQKLFNRSHHLLVAVSGGIDSMVLCEILLKLKYSFSVAHVNYKLRGKESDGDEHFIKQFCKSKKINCYTSTCNTKALAKQSGRSVQMTAREVRYAFFAKLKQEHRFDFVLTAHHLNDSIETYFINTIRGTGIDGLKGIQSVNGFIIRPLLVFTRKQITDYALQNQIEFREDSSNNDDKYMRNYIRHHIIPEFTSMNPAFEEGLKRQLAFLTQYNSIIQKHIQKEIKKIVKQTNHQTIIHIAGLLKSTTPELLLFEILKPFRFDPKQTEKIIESSKGTSGKVFHAPEHILRKERTNLIIEEKHDLKKPKQGIIGENDDEILIPVKIKLKKVKKITLPVKPSVIYTDKAKLIYPLKIRGWKTGDKIKPFGMKGSKKISDLFTEYKLNSDDKNNLLILENGNKEIIWVLKLKFDDRFKVTNTTKEIIKFEIIES